MHKSSMDQMRKHLVEFTGPPCKILDVGSANISNTGCYRTLLPEGYHYTGLDLGPGENVDVVIEDPYNYPFEDSTFDAVMCGQVLEHCKNPFKLIKECARVLKPGGVFLGAAPFIWEQHRVPVDCWRILPDGWEALFDHAGLITVKTSLVTANEQGWTDCWGIAKKP